MWIDWCCIADMPVYRRPDKTKHGHLNRAQACNSGWLHWNITLKELPLHSPCGIPLARSWIELQYARETRTTLKTIYRDPKRVHGN